MAAPSTGFGRFAVLWGGQFVSLAGSALSGFALGVYAYQRTGSVTVLGFVYALTYLPLILVSPFTGALVDRWGAHRSLVTGNVASALVMLTLATLLLTKTFVVWQVFLVVGCLSVISALMTPAFETTVPLLVPKEHLGRANGMRMAALATSQVLAPVTAGALLFAIRISGIILVDCVSYGAALLALALVRIPRASDGPARAGGLRTLLADFREAWRYVGERRGLVALAVFIGALNFCCGFVDLLITPLILAFGTSRALGTVMSVGGVGMVLTSVAMSIWGGPRHLVRGILGFSLAIGAATVVGSLRPDIPLIAVGACLFLGSLAIVTGTNMTIWQTKVAPQLLGRTMAMLNMFVSLPQLIAYALAGVAADQLFDPLVGRDRVRSSLFAALVGHGPGRGTAFLLMVIGVLVIIIATAGFALPRLRLLETELPDATGEEPAVPADPLSTAAANSEVTP